MSEECKKQNKDSNKNRNNSNNQGNEGWVRIKLLGICKNNSQQLKMHNLLEIIKKCLKMRNFKNEIIIKFLYLTFKIYC